MHRASVGEAYGSNVSSTDQMVNERTNAVIGFKLNSGESVHTVAEKIKKCESKQRLCKWLSLCSFLGIFVVVLVPL